MDKKELNQNLNYTTDTTEDEYEPILNIDDIEL